MFEYKIRRERYIEKCVKAAGIAEKCKIETIFWRQKAERKWRVEGVRVSTYGTSPYYSEDIAHAIGRYFSLAYLSPFGRLKRRIERGRRWKRSDGAILQELLDDEAMRNGNRMDFGE